MTTYEDFYDLRAPPFEPGPDTRFFFASRQHSNALISLEHDTMLGAGFRVITGDAGTGKTALLGHMLSRPESSDALASQLTVTELPPEDILRRVAASLGGQTGQTDIDEVVGELSEVLKSCHETQRRALLFVDEAESLSDSALEALCFLSDLGVDRGAFFEIFLLGREAFRLALIEGRLPAVRQRVVSSYQLQPMDPEDTRGYIEHRLRLVDWQGDPSFSVKSFERIYEQTGGLPHTVNIFCNALMEQGYLDQLNHINVAVVLQVAMDMRLKGLLAGDAVPEPAAALPARPPVERSPPPDPSPEPSVEPAGPEELVLAGPAQGLAERRSRPRRRGLRLALALLLFAVVAGGLMSLSGELDKAEPGEARPAARLAATPEPEPASESEAAEAQTVPTETAAGSAGNQETPAQDVGAAPLPPPPAPVVEFPQSETPGEGETAAIQVEQPDADVTDSAATKEPAAVPTVPPAGAQTDKIDVVAVPPEAEPKASLLASGDLEPLVETAPDTASEIIADRFLKSPSVKLADPAPAQPRQLAQATEQTPEAPAPPSSPGLVVSELVLTRSIVDREPVDSTESFAPGDGRAFAFARIANPGEPSAISFVWIYGEAIHATIDLKIGTSPNWRTWSSVQPQSGAWRVQIVTEDNQVLAERAFTVE